MNEIERAITATMRADAQEASMKTDMFSHRVELNERLDSVDRRRGWTRVGLAVAAAAAVVVAGVIVVATRSQTVPPATGPDATASPTPTVSASPFAFSSSDLTPDLTVDLPAWTRTSSPASGAGSVVFDQPGCDVDPCPPNQALKIRMYSVLQMYRPNDTTMTRNPTYAAVLAVWDGLADLGFGTATDRSTTTVDGRPAVTMTLAMDKDAPGTAFCETPTTAAADCFFPIAGRTYRLAVVNQGQQPPTVLYESYNTGDPAADSVHAEFATWLATVSFV